MNTRLVAAFRGEAQCRRETGAVQWRLCGLDRDSDAALEVLLCGAAGPELPARLAAAELYVRGEPDSPAWELRSGDEVLVLAARAVQVHRGAAVAFARALPPVTAAVGTRVGWALLLNALRIPGTARLLQKLRGQGGAA